MCDVWGCWCPEGAEVLPHLLESNWSLSGWSCGWSCCRFSGHAPALQPSDVFEQAQALSQKKIEFHISADVSELLERGAEEPEVPEGERFPLGAFTWIGVQVSRLMEILNQPSADSSSTYVWLISLSRSQQLWRWAPCAGGWSQHGDHCLLQLLWKRRPWPWSSRLTVSGRSTQWPKWQRWRRTAMRTLRSPLSSSPGESWRKADSPKMVSVGGWGWSASLIHISREKIKRPL